MAKFEYISDKDMYAAVMGACSYIRSTGFFNKAVSYYARKYHVDKDELAAHIRKRQSVGQKNKYAPKIYKYFCCVKVEYTESSYTVHGHCIVRRCTTPEKAKHCNSKFDYEDDRSYHLTCYKIIGNPDGYMDKEKAVQIQEEYNLSPSILLGDN